jgi:protein-S-isoprenylcysteine O-methyltransferase Ste14
MEFSFIRIALLLGLVLHKVVWEILKRKQAATPAAAKAPRSLKVRVLSTVKVVILLAIVAQTLLPDFLPISSDPGTLRTIGAVVYAVGLLAAVTARIQLGRNWSDIEKSYVQRDHQVVAHGLYRWVRHPIYAGDLILLLGLELALNSWCVLGVVVLAGYVRHKAIGEERKLLSTLPGYDQYFRRTTRFLPFVPV